MINLRFLLEGVIMTVSLSFGLLIITGLPLFGIKNLSWVYSGMKFPPLWIANVCGVVFFYWWRCS